jgi:hypothetical protein
MKYKDLIDLGFERFEMGDGFDMLGFYDFYLFLKVSKEISFEWNWQKKDIVKMVHYKKSDVQNYIEIIDFKTLKDFIYLYKEKAGNSGIKPKIGVDNSTKCSAPLYA